MNWLYRFHCAVFSYVNRVAGFHTACLADRAMQRVTGVSAWSSTDYR